MCLAVNNEGDVLSHQETAESLAQPLSGIFTCVSAWHSFERLEVAMHERTHTERSYSTHVGHLVENRPFLFACLSALSPFPLLAWRSHQPKQNR